MKNKGYTLIELAIVFTIGGVMIASTGSMMLVYMKQAKVSETTSRLERVDIAIKQYFKSNGKYPCPASRTADVEATDFGYEASTDCTGSLTGTVSSSGVRIGSLPVRSMNLPDEDIVDGWGNRLLYAVTISQAEPQSFKQDGGAIRIIDKAGNNAQFPPASAHYLVASHGPDGAGAYTLHGQLFRGCGTAAPQAENCNDDNTFRTVLKASNGSPTDAYDDIITYSAQFDTAVETALFPQNAVASFNGACPGGWTEYADAAGRVIVGIGNYNESFSDSSNGLRKGWTFPHLYVLGERDGYARWAMSVEEMPEHTHGQLVQQASVQSGSTALSLGITPTTAAFTEATDNSMPIMTPSADQPHDNRQPYHALRYCKKD